MPQKLFTFLLEKLQLHFIIYNYSLFSCHIKIFKTDILSDFMIYFMQILK